MVYRNKRDDYKRGFALPWTWNVGPLNTPKLKSGLLPVDKAAFWHDKAYARVIKKGGDPYTKWVLGSGGDDDLLRKALKHPLDPSSMFTIGWFGPKKLGSYLLNRYEHADSFRKVAGAGEAPSVPLKDRMNLGSKRVLADIGGDAPEKRQLIERETAVSNSYMFSGKSTHKFYSGIIRFSGKTIKGRYIPFQKHTIIDGFALEVLASKKEYHVYELMDMDVLNNKMFTGRYLQTTKDVLDVAGTNNVIGPTYHWLMKATGSLANARNTGIFQMGSLSTANIATADLPNQPANLNASNSFDAVLNRYSVMLNFSYGSIVKVKNNYSAPVNVCVYEVMATDDFLLAPGIDWSADVVVTAEEDYRMNHSNNNWDPDTKGAMPPDTALTVGFAKEPWFDFTDVSKKGIFRKKFCLANKRVMHLGPGEFADFFVKKNKVRCLMSDIQARMLKLGVNLTSTTDLGINGKGIGIKKLNHGLVFQIMGDIGHGTGAFLGQVGTIPTGIDVTVKTTYSWSLKGDDFKAVPTKGCTWSSNVTDYNTPFTPGV